MPTDPHAPAASSVDRLADAFGADGAATLLTAIEDATRPGRHGRLPDWQTVLDALPPAEKGWAIEDGSLVAGRTVDRSVDNPDELADALKGLIPWRKGPLKLGGVAIDTEWRSDWKWNRVAPSVDLAGRRVLDIGSGNGYFAWRMLAAGASSVIACDPTLVFWMQHRAICHFAGDAPLDLLPLKLEVLPQRGTFDVAFSMGVLYHRRDPLEHLARIRRHLSPGGVAVIETLVLPGDHRDELDPPDRYANMRNVHRLPTVPRLLDWLEQAEYSDASCVDVTPTTVQEQRPTDWMPFHSLEHALSTDRQTTAEGHPPPLRATVVARTR